MKRIQFILFFSLLTSIHTASGASWLRGNWGDADKNPELWNCPLWVIDLVEKKNFDKKYKFISRLNPFYLRGDFNGDNKLDIAVFIEELSSKKQGIAILNYGSEDIFVVGAGKNIRVGGDDFSWMDIWSVRREGPVERGVEEGTPPLLKGEAINVGKSESSSAIIYWTGSKYDWYHQGD